MLGTACAEEGFVTVDGDALGGAVGIAGAGADDEIFFINSLPALPW